MSVVICTHRSSASTASGLVTKLSGDLVVADNVSSNHLTLVDGASLAPAGKIGEAFDFNGAAGRYMLCFYAGTDRSFFYTVEFEVK